MPCTSGLCGYPQERTSSRPSRDVSTSQSRNYYTNPFASPARYDTSFRRFGGSHEAEKIPKRFQSDFGTGGGPKLKCPGKKGFPGIRDGPYSKLIEECGGGYPDFVSRFGENYLRRVGGRIKTAAFTYRNDRYLKNIPSPTSSWKVGTCGKSYRTPILRSVFCGAVGGGGFSDFIGGNGVGPYRTHAYTNIIRGNLCGAEGRPEVAVDSYGKRSELMRCHCGKKR